MFFDQGGRHHWFAKYLKKEGYNPTIFCANTVHNSDVVIEFNGLYKKDISEDIKYIFVKTTKTVSNGLDRVKNMITFYLNVKRVARKMIKAEGKPDVILASSVHPLTLVAGIHIGKKYNIPVICEIRDLWPESIVAYSSFTKEHVFIKALYKLEKWTYKNADALVFTMEGGKQYIKDRKWDFSNDGAIDLNKVFYINNGIDIDSFEQNVLTNHYDLVDKEKYIVTYTGSIRRVNKVDLLLDAAELIADNDIIIHIYGDGDQKLDLEQRAINRGIKNVLFNGRVNKKFVPSILRQSNLNIISGESIELFNYGLSANKNFDYLASGNPILSTFSTNYSIIKNYNVGSELTTPNPQEIANAILTFKNMSLEESKVMNENIRRAVQEFDFKNLTSKLISIIEGESI